MQHETTVQTASGLSTYSQHLYVFLLMVLVMTLANTYWPASRAKDCRPAVLPPPIKSCDVYPAPVSINP